MLTVSNSIQKQAYGTYNNKSTTSHKLLNPQQTGTFDATQKSEEDLDLHGENFIHC